MFSERLKQVRENYGLSQLDFSQEISVSVATYNAYETGKQYPRINVIKRICEKYNVSADWLLGVNAIENIKSDADWLKTIVSLIDSGAAVEVVKIDWPKEWREDGELIASQDTILVFIDGDGLNDSVEELMNLKNLVQKEVIDENVFKLWFENEIKKLSENEPLRRLYISELAKNTAERINGDL